VSVPVEAMLAELPRDLQNPVVVSPVVRLVFSPTPAVNSADVDDEAMAAIGQRVVGPRPYTLGLIPTYASSVFRPDVQASP
jgi:hypothetical protein